MNSRLLVLLMVFWTGSLWAAELHGIVQLNELGGQPISDVRVEAVPATSPMATDAAGRFTLEFVSSNPGDDVHLILSKEGLVVVNSSLLQARLSSDPSSRPLELLMSTPENKQEMAMRFYRLKWTESVNKHYEEELARLRASLELTEERATEL